MIANETKSPMVSSGSDHQSRRIRTSSFVLGGGKGTLIFIVVPISTMPSILSVTQAEVTVRGCLALILAGLAIAIVLRHTPKPPDGGPTFAQQTTRVILEHSKPQHLWPSAIIRLTIGCALAGSAVAVITSVVLSIVFTNFVGRLA